MERADGGVKGVLLVVDGHDHLEHQPAIYVHSVSPLRVVMAYWVSSAGRCRLAEERRKCLMTR